MLPKVQRFGKFDTAALYAYKGGNKPKKAKVIETPTQYEGINSSTFSGPFGSGSSSLNKATGSIDSTATLNGALQNVADTAQSGLGNNLAYLNRNPQEQVSFATGGQDPYYNVLSQQAQHAFDNNLGRLRLDAFKGGGSNSTAAGAAYGNLAYNKNLYDNQVLLSALQYGNQNALQGAQANLGAIGGLAQLVYPLESAANAQLNTAMQSKDRASAATTAAQNQAEANYRAAMNQYNASRMTPSQFFSTLSPAYGVASGNYNEAMQGINNTLSLAGAAMGASGGGGVPYIPPSNTNSTPSPNMGASSGYSSNFPQMNPYYSSPQFLNLGMAVA